MPIHMIDKSKEEVEALAKFATTTVSYGIFSS